MIAHWDLVLRLVAAMAGGMLLGLNRDLHGKPTGMRTLGLVGLSAAAVTLAAADLDLDSHDMNTTTGHVMQGILTGIGFLGAGVILHDAPGIRVHGLTTAATVLVTAALGIVFGLGNWITGGACLGLSLFTLVFAGPLEHYLRRRFRGLRPANDDDADNPESGG
jgi:putative Mg2+ transporter-C (MgtC) family protein